MITIDATEIIQLERDLKKLSTRALPIVTRNTINMAAMVSRDRSRNTVRREMTLRNQWTERGIQAKTTGSRDINHQESEVGSYAKYMGDQEFGGTKRGKGKIGLPIPTGFSSGEGDAPRPRKRLPRPSRKMRKIILSNKIKRFSNKKQENIVKIKMAIKTSNRFVYIDTGKRRGIMRVIGGSKRQITGTVRGATIKDVHDLTRRSIVIKRNPWLMPSVLKTQKQIPEIYYNKLIGQIVREQLFRSGNSRGY